MPGLLPGQGERAKKLQRSLNPLLPAKHCRGLSLRAIVRCPLPPATRLKLSGDPSSR